MNNLSGSHAVVTGGASGIGLAIATALAGCGARVTVASRNLERIEKVTSDLPGVSGVALDVTVPNSVAAVFDTVGDVDILVNNSGIALAGSFDSTTLEQLTDVMAVNLNGVFLCTQAVVSGMRKKNRGRIINVASTAGLRGYAYTSVYCASKHAVVGMTRSLALELASTEITVNCVCPGFTDTNIVSDAVARICETTGRTQAAALAALTRHNPQNRLVTADEVADAVVWLCGENAAAINGQSIAVAGGEIM